MPADFDRLCLVFQGNFWNCPAWTFYHSKVDCFGYTRSSSVTPSLPLLSLPVPSSLLCYLQLYTINSLFQLLCNSGFSLSSCSFFSCYQSSPTSQLPPFTKVMTCFSFHFPIICLFPFIPRWLLASFLHSGASIHLSILPCQAPGIFVLHTHTCTHTGMPIIWLTSCWCHWSLVMSICLNRVRQRI